MKKIFGVGLAVALFVAALYALSWIITCGVIKLITVCFGLEFSWAIATGIWLIMCLAKKVFSHHTTINNK